MHRLNQKENGSFSEYFENDELFDNLTDEEFNALSDNYFILNAI